MTCCEHTRQSWPSLEFQSRSSASSHWTRPPWVVRCWARGLLVSYQPHLRVTHSLVHKESYIDLLCCVLTCWNCRVAFCHRGQESFRACSSCVDRSCSERFEDKAHFKFFYSLNKILAFLYFYFIGEETHFNILLFFCLNVWSNYDMDCCAVKVCTAL